MQELRFYSKMQKLFQELDFTVKYKSYYSKIQKFMDMG